ncbi:MAG: hypothetical protein ACI8WT_004239 [Clostridium sp.]|jgi:hypothetical protein
MVTWGNSYFVIGPVIGLIYLILQFLIKKYNIKPNKVSRIFYEDDESFIKSWEKIREKGMLRYTIKTTTIIMVTLAILVVFPILVKFGMYEFNQQMLFDFLRMGGIFGLLISLFLWCVKSFRYSELED